MHRPHAGPSLANHARGSSRALRHQAAVAQVSQGRIRAPKWWVGVGPRTDASTCTCCSEHAERCYEPKKKITSTVRGGCQQLTVCANDRSQETSMAEELGLQGSLSIFSRF
jgi:hypothetical protein